MYGIDHDGFNRKGFDKDGYNREGLDRQGFSRNKYNAFGVDRAGHCHEYYEEYLSLLNNRSLKSYLLIKYGWLCWFTAIFMLLWWLHGQSALLKGSFS